MRRLIYLQIPSRQRGVTLAIALIFLVILTLLGLSAMRVTTMEERMAGNTRDRGQAFQWAEAGLRNAEQNLAGIPFSSFNSTCTNALCAQGSAPDWKTYLWDGSKDVQATATNGITVLPKYFIEYAGETKCPKCSGGWASVYRITVRGQGNNTATTVFLEGTYRP